MRSYLLCTLLILSLINEGRQINELCNFLANAGPCNGEYKMFAYDVFTGRCTEFVYGGCGGNPNRFDTEQKCRDTCLARRQVKTAASPEPDYNDYTTRITEN